MATNYEALVDRYVKLRDAKSELKKRYEEKVALVEQAQLAIETLLLKEFDALGIESAKTASGTAYKTTKTFAQVGDWDAILDFIQQNDMWSMLERRVSKTAVEQWKKENGDAIPPGVNWREELTINVRRS